jgi:branched-chain amino acid aminotransferase
MPWICHNGLFVPHQQPVFTAANRSFKWGDGVFETARFYQGRLLLATYHFERLFSSLQVLQMQPQVTAEQLTEHIVALCEKNGCSNSARMRLALYREERNSAAFLIEATALPESIGQWTEQGWRLVLYPFARKSVDAFANLKTANYLPYVMAGLYASEKDADEALVLNTYNRICDGGKTNLFFLKENAFYTPALQEGCVAGVMRRHIIETLKQLGYAVHQQPITEDALLQADEIFMTNAIEGLRWVRQFGDTVYEHEVLKKLHLALVASYFC